MSPIAKKITGAILCVAATVLLVGTVVGNVQANNYGDLLSVYFGHSTYQVVDDGDSSASTIYYPREFHTEEERLAEEAKLNRQIEGEGIVLLQNNNHALPLSSGNKISVFGVASRDFIYGGTGSGTIDVSSAPTFQQAMESGGFEVNPTLVDFYQNGRGSRYVSSVADISGGGSYQINECPGAAFTNSVKNSFAQYQDAAVVVIARAGSESSDLPKTASNALDRSYLDITPDEESMLELVADSGFSKIVVVINSATPMNLSFLEQARYNIDAAIWVGDPGQNGLFAIADILNGTTNPSGRLVDTYARNVLGAPAIQNQGSYRYSNGRTDIKATGYMVYAEGIYVGYRYYETRYADCVNHYGNASSPAGSIDGALWDYSKEVQYPFGYGLSYSKFEYSNLSVEENGDNFVITIQVKNSGEVAGKEVVQVYAQAPYTDYDRENRIEKSAVSLVGFAKTKLLGSNQSEEVQITVEKERLKTYDAAGKGTYILESGDYSFGVGKSSHDALNNILASQGKRVSDGMDAEGNPALAKTISVNASDEYRSSKATGNAISNAFADVDVRTYDSSFSYLSRSDWSLTFPKTYQNGAWDVPETILHRSAISYQQDDETLNLPSTSKQTGLSLIMFRDEPYDSPRWDDLLDTLSADELKTLVKDGGYMIKTAESIVSPSALNLDGPAGIASVAGITVVLREKPFSWVSEVVLAATWNVSLAKRMGELVGEDGLANSVDSQKVNGWYAPGVNIHRTPFSGRNFEYFSEDPYLSGRMAAKEIGGARSKGLITYAKHFALNDQETSRTAGAMYANEQSIREIYLLPFEYAVREGGSLGVMVSMNRVGPRWSGGHKGLMTSTLREEWGFHGIAVTDQASYASFSYCDIREGLEAGTDMWLNTDATLWNDQLTGYATNALLLTQLRRAAKNILYGVSRSLAINGLSSASRIVSVTPTWKYWLIGADIALGLMCAAGYVFGAILIFKKKKQN